MSIQHPAQKTWWIAHNNGGGVCHFGLIQTNQQVTTGQPTLEDFTDATTFIQRLVDMGEEIATQKELDSLLDGATISEELTSQILTTLDEE